MKLIIVLLIFSLQIVAGQSKLDKLIFNVGVSLGEPDARYSFLEGQFGAPIIEAVKNDNPSYFQELFFGVSTEMKLIGGLYANLGLGLSALYNDFGLPVDGWGYFDVGNKKFYTNKYSISSNLHPITELRYYIVDRDNFRIYAGFSSSFLISFNKTYFRIAPNFSRNLSRFKIAPYSLGLFPSIGLQIRKVGYHLDYRLYHFKYRDDSIANNGLEIDRYNPIVFRFRLTHDLYDH